jgi:hypothetical protein
MPEAHDTLIAELRYCAQMFLGIDKVFEKWLDILMSSVGYTREQLEAEAQRLEPEIRQVHVSELEDLRKELQEKGAI